MNINMERKQQKVIKVKATGSVLLILQQVSHLCYTMYVFMSPSCIILKNIKLTYVKI